MPESVTSETVFSATDSQNGRVEETRPIAIEFQHNPSMRSALERANELPAESSAAPVIAASSAPSAAADQKGMSILEAVERTIAWHPTIGEALGRLYQQGEQVSVARSGYYPQVSAGVATERRSSTGRSEDAVTVSASQMLYDFGRVSSQVDAANFGVNRDQARVWLAMDQLARDAAQAAIEVQRYQALLDIAREQIAGLTDIQKLAARRSELGASTRSDEIQAQSRVEAAKATELQIEAQLLTWQNTVRTLVGASGPVNINRDFPEPLTQSCALASEDFDNVPELMVAEAEQAEARAIIAQTQASFFPTVSLDADLNQFLNRDVAEDDTEVIMRVNLSSNLYQGGATSARRRAADYSLQASQAAKDAAYLSLSRSLREAKEQTASFGLRLVTLDARARSIRDTQQLYRQQYLSLGTRSLLDLLNAEQEIHQSRFDQENTRYDLYRLQIDCLYSSADIRDAFGLEDSMVQGVSVSP
nr:TolC family outer membrane protein [Halomonas sp.]